MHLRSLAEQKNRSPGPDAWTLEELKALPTRAWANLLNILDGLAAPERICSRDSSGVLPPSLSLLFRHVPLPKGDGLSPLPSQIRPIDIYATPMRIYSAMVCKAVREWTLQVAHPSQNALSKGVHQAAAAIEVATEWRWELEEELQQYLLM